MNALRLFLTGLTTSLVAAAALAVTPQPALAAPDARIDAQIRPCFGVLTTPDIANRCKPAKRRGPSGPPRPPIVKTTIDCAMAPPGIISDTIAKAWDGVTITLKSSTGRACQEAVVINRPARIVGDYGYTPTFEKPLLTAPPGAPCIRLAPSIWVAFENITFGQIEGDAAPCLMGQSNEVTLVNSNLLYSGSGGAVVLAGQSRLVLDRVHVVARSQEAAVSVRGRVKVLRSSIAAAVMGLKVYPTDDMVIDGLEITRLDDWTGSRRSAGSAGLMLADIGPNHLVEVNGLDILGFSRGAYLSGAGEVNLRAPMVRAADWALLVEGPEVRLSRARLDAGEVGVYAAAGTIYVSNSEIRNVMRSGIFAERGAQVRSVDNTVYAAKGGCAALKTGYFNGALTCRPWFEAPQLGGGKDDPVLPTFDSVQALFDSERAAVQPQPFMGGPSMMAAPIPGAPKPAAGAAPQAQTPPGASQGGPSK